MANRVKVTGSGAAICAVCNGKLDYSWTVMFSDASSEHRCTVHLPEKFDDR